MATRKKTSIERFSLPLCYVTVASTEEADDEGWDNVATSRTCTCIEAKYCTVQVKNTTYMDLDFSGVKSDTVYWVFTNTPVFTPEEGTAFLGTYFYIPDVFFGDGSSTFTVPGKGGWFKVIAADPCLNGVVNHYECFIAKATLATSESLPTDKESIFTDLTRSEFMDADWVDDWVEEVTV